MVNSIHLPLGGPDGELGAATRYLQQRYSMPYAQVKGMLTDIGTEEFVPYMCMSFYFNNNNTYEIEQNCKKRRALYKYEAIKAALRLAGKQIT